MNDEFLSIRLELLSDIPLVGFGIGAFFSLMSSSFAYEDPLLRAQTQANLNTAQKAREIFKDMGKGSVGQEENSAKCFGVTFRARHDLFVPTHG